MIAQLTYFGSACGSTIDPNDRMRAFRHELGKQSSQLDDLSRASSSFVRMHVGEAQARLYSCGTADVYAPATAIGQFARCAKSVFKVGKRSSSPFLGFYSFIFRDSVPHQSVSHLVSVIEKLASDLGLTRVAKQSVDNAIFITAEFADIRKAECANEVV